MYKKRKKAGFTLIELQVGAVMMVVVLLAGGVIFYFALNCMRFIQDAYEVYWNAQNAMKIIQQEVMRANRYGWQQEPDWSRDINGVNSLYGSGVNAPYIDYPDVWFAMPTLGGSPSSPATNNLASNVNDPVQLYLRQDSQTSSLQSAEYAGGGFAGSAWTYADDEITLLYHTFTESLDGTGELRVERPGINAIAQVMNGVLVASGVTDLEFRRIAFNALAVELQVTGSMVSPLGGQYNQIHIYTVVNLRCAPANTCEPWAHSNYALGYW